MSDSKDRYNFIHNKLPSSHDSKKKDKIAASDLEGEVVKNLKLLKGLIRSEKVKGQLFAPDAESVSSRAPLETVQNKIIEELFSLGLNTLALFSVPKKYFDECFELLISAWRRKIQHHYPQTLTFEDVKFSKESFRAFIIALSLNVSLKALRLQHCRLRTFEIKLLAVLIKVHPTLIFLHLDHNPFGDEGLYSVIAALRLNEKIEHLSLIDTDITDVGALKLCSLISSRPLKSLHLDKNNLTKKSIEELSKINEGSQDVITFDEPIDLQ